MGTRRSSGSTASSPSPLFLFFSLQALLQLPSFCNANGAPVRLRVEDTHVVLDNGLVVLTLNNPGGSIASVSYNGVDNILEPKFAVDRRGYWDISWNNAGRPGGFDGWRIHSSQMKVIRENEGVVELSFIANWDSTGNTPSLNFDLRYVMLRGSSGFYTYAIYEHQKGWPDLNIYESRVALKLDKERFHYMAISDDRQRQMPMPEDRMPPRGKVLAFKEAVQLVDPIDSQFKGEVDDKYQYSMDNQDSKVHGWIGSNPPIGVWMITPSIEFKTGGPLKQDLTSHTGPVTLSMFISVHYTGDEIAVQLRNGEYWKKVFGPVFIHLNSNADRAKLWSGAKAQMEQEVNAWPYEFVASQDFLKANERGSVSGRLFVRDRLVDVAQTPATSAHVGLAPVGDVGSWQTESKGYQFWTVTDKSGQFSIRNVRPGVYSLFSWVPGFIGEYKYESTITITSGKQVSLGELIYDPPRDGPPLWEIGIPDRSAAEFYVPDPQPDLVNPLYLNTREKFRQYGLWDRYSDLYANGDLVFTIGTSDYKKDWFFAHVNRRTKNSAEPYEETTWKIKFTLDKVVPNSIYKFRLAIASATSPILHVWFNDPQKQPPHFSTQHIRAENNAIARHAIHAMHWLFTWDIESGLFVQGENVVYLTQTNGKGAFAGLMYDYIRLEGPTG